MMCGKPIITNDKTSMAGIVHAENCGLIVPYGDISAIKNAIIMLKEDPDLCNLLGANGRRAYEQKYSWTIMEKRLLAVYERLTD
jgi:glycosyltransferase involved in cell wall biosynthesis